MTREQLRAALDSVTVVDAQPPARYGRATSRRAQPRRGGLRGVRHGRGAGRGRPCGRVLDRRRLPPRTELAARLEALGYADVRIYHGGIGDWVAAGLALERPRAVTLELSDRHAARLRNVGDVPLLVVSVHERGTLRQTWLGVDPA